MSEFVRFPHTPHLAWLGTGRPRQDKVLDAEAAEALLSSQVLVEEKVDGANLGFSVDDAGRLRGQNRGGYLELQTPAGQWKPLKRWLEGRSLELEQALAQGLIIFGEWCYAVHSVRYSRLPDWFLAFDVYDRRTGEFWSADRRDELARRLDLSVVPALARGRFDLSALTALLGQSQLTDGPAEGLYVRCDQRGHLAQRAKLVRPEFMQHIDTHWSRRPLALNRLERTPA